MGETIHVARPTLLPVGTDVLPDNYTFTLNGNLPEPIGNSVSGYDMTFSAAGYYYASAQMSYSGRALSKEILFIIADSNELVPGDALKLNRSEIDSTVYFAGGERGFWETHVQLSNYVPELGTPVWAVEKITGAALKNLRVTNSYGNYWCYVGYDAVLGVGEVTADLVCRVGEYSTSIPITIHVLDGTVPTSMVTPSLYDAKAGETIHIARPALEPAVTDLDHDLFYFQLDSSFGVSGNSDDGYDAMFSEPGYYTARIRMYYADVRLTRNIVFRIADNDSILPPVIPVTSIDLDQERMVIAIGERQGLYPSMTPANASIRTLVWTSDDEDVAKVNQDGTITGMGPGSATITAIAMDGSGVFDACLVTVVEPIYVTFTMPNTVAVGSPITASWAIEGGEDPYVQFLSWNIYEDGWHVGGSQPVISGNTSTYTPNFGDRGMLNLEIRDRATGLYKNFNQYFAITGVTDQPLTAKIILNKTSVSVGEPITATYAILGGVLPYTILNGQWSVNEMDSDNWSGYDGVETEGTSVFTPTYGVRGNYQLQIRDGAGREKWISSNEFTITGAPDPLVVTVDLPGTVVANNPITASWTITGGVDPYVENGSWIFYEDDNQGMSYNAAIAGSKSTFIPLFGDTGRFNLLIMDRGTGQYKSIEKSFTITGSPPPIEVTVTMASSVNAGQTITASWTITNLSLIHI